MNPERWDKFRDRYLRNESRSTAFNRFENMVNEEIEKGTIRQIRPIDLLMNIMSLTISAFIVAPKGFASDECDKSARKAYLDHRREDVKELIVSGIKINY